MALVPNTWYELAFASIADPPWTVPNFAISGQVIDAIIGASSVLCFCTADDGTNSTFITFKNAVMTAPTAALTVVSTPPMNTTVMNDGETWYSVRGPTTQWYFYGDQAGVVRALTNSTTLGAFIS